MQQFLQVTIEFKIYFLTYQKDYLRNLYLTETANQFSSIFYDELQNEKKSSDRFENNLFLSKLSKCTKESTADEKAGKYTKA